MTGTVRILFILHLALILLASVSMTTPLWGASAWSHVSFTMAFILSAVSACLLHNGMADKAANIIPDRRSPALWTVAAVCVAAPVLMWTFRSGHGYWGDGIRLSSLIESGEWLKSGAPIGTALNQAMYRFVNTLFFSNSTAAISLTGILCGLLFIIVSSSIACLHAAGEGTRTRICFLSTLFMAANGYFVVFFGSGGNAAPGILFSSLFILAALSHIRGKTRIIVPLALFMISFFTHISAICLLPGVLLIIAGAFSRSKSVKRPVLAVSAVLIAWIAADLAMSRHTGFPGPSRYIIQSLAARLESTSSVPAGKITALWANELLILGPSTLTAMVLVFLKARKNAQSALASSGEERFLLILVISAVLFIIVGAGRIDGGLRWDIFAATGPAFAVFSLWKLGRLLPDRRDFGRAMILLSAAGLLHMTPLIAVGSSERLGRDRLLSLPLAPGTAERTIGLREMESENFAGAAEWFSKAVAKAPHDDSSWFALGQASMKEEEYLDAITDFTKALKIKPGDRVYSENLVEAYIGQRWFEEASDRLDQLIRADSTNVRHWTRLGFVLNNSGRYEEAVRAYERALSFDPGDEQYRMNLASAMLNRGAELHENKQYDEAEKYYDGVIVLLPGNWIALNNRATLAMDMGDYEKAYGILGLALKSNSFSAKLHYNMGLVQEKRGNYAEAFEHLKECAELDPNVPPPSDDLERVYLKLKEEGAGQ